MIDKEKEINLLGLDVSEHTEKKGKLTYLSWAWAATEMLKAYPDVTYSVERDADGNMYHGNPAIGYMVNTTVTAAGITREMWLPVMDNYNRTLKNPTMTDINKAIMRCLTKNFAMFGLGLYIYAGEDLPEGEEKPQEAAGQQDEQKPARDVPKPQQAAQPAPAKEYCSEQEINTLKGLCEMAGQDPKKLFAKYNWPWLTKKQYADGCNQIREHLKKNGSKGNNTEH